MKTKHNKGEWRIISNLNQPNDLCIHVEGKTICTMPEGWLNSDNENNANAKLIAAAPELLEALMIMIEDNGYDISLPIEGFSHRTQKVIKAIKKAT